MVLYPDVQKVAHEELDSIVGADRFPNWEDWLSLPYVRSCMKETHRCKNIPVIESSMVNFSGYPVTLTGGFPHAAAKDDIYKGYTIPAGAGILNNVKYFRPIYEEFRALTLLGLDP